MISTGEPARCSFVPRAGSERRMPIPPDVGAAIVAYLRNGRPKSSCRRLFIRTLAPHVGFASGCAITMIAKTALDRVGIRGLRTPRRPYLPAQPRHRASPFRRNLVGDRPAAAAREPRHHADLREGRHRGAADIEPAVAGRRAMTDLRSALERYLSMRKGLGYKYQHQTRRLADFVAFMEKRKAKTITTKLAMEWATLPPDRHASWALRLTDVRGFARHVANIDPRRRCHPSASCRAGSVPSPMSTATRRSMRCWRRRWPCRQRAGCGDGPTTTCSD